MFAADRPTWQNPRILTILVLVFATGAMAGALGMRIGLHQRLHPGGGGASLKDPNTTKVFLERCERELNLSTEQTNQMRTVLDDYKLYYQELQTQIEDVRATGKSRIMAVLNNDQKAKFEKLLSEVK